jgi:hypothetical protein
VDLMALSRMLCESPPVSHIANPARSAVLIYSPFAAIGNVSQKTSNIN